MDYNWINPSIWSHRNACTMALNYSNPVTLATPLVKMNGKLN